MRAREGGTCRLCGRRYEPGDEVNRYGSGTAHERCIGENYSKGQKKIPRQRGKDWR